MPAPKNTLYASIMVKVYHIESMIFHFQLYLVSCVKHLAAILYDFRMGL